MTQSSRGISTRLTVSTFLTLAAITAAHADALTLSDSDITSVFTIAQSKYNNYYNSLSTNTLNRLGSTSSPPTAFPASSANDTTWSKVDASDWRSGFYAGVLWEVYGRTGNATVKTEAENFTFGERNNVANASADHDVGFKSLPSYGLGSQYVGGNFAYTYQSVTDLTYSQQIMNAADHLASRYVPAVGMTRSWGNPGDADTQVIVDNMMNIQVLFAAANLGDTTTVSGTTLTQIAINHARNTFTNFVRADGSSVHEVDFNTNTGAINFKQSVQGITSFGQDTPAITGQTYETVGTWSRGQSWLINGFTQTYQNTNMPEFLADAQTVANYWVTRTLQNVAAGHSYIPPSDFDVSLVGVADDVDHQDCSAAAIAADGLMQLALYTTDPALKAQYWDVAVHTLQDLLSSTYFNSDPSKAALLMHGAQQFTVANNDTSFIYADYYFLDALNRYQTLAPSFASTPEPTSLALLAFPVGLTLLRRRRASH